MNGIESVRSRVIAPNTVEYQTPEGKRVIRLHQTDIIEFLHRNGDIRLNTGGWLTVTTKERLNRFLPGLSIYSIKGVWMISNAGQWDNGVPFYDGMILRNGRVPLPTIRDEQRKRGVERLKTRINKFVNQLDKMDNLPEPNGGDCWSCSMFDRSALASGERKMKDPSHIRSHITVKENYLHGSLIHNALVWAGCTPEGIGIRWHWFNEGTYKGEIKRYLYRYLKAQLGVA